MYKGFLLIFLLILHTANTIKGAMKVIAQVISNSTALVDVRNANRANERAQELASALALNTSIDLSCMLLLLFQLILINDTTVNSITVSGAKAIGHLFFINTTLNAINLKGIKYSLALISPPFY